MLGFPHSNGIPITLADCYQLSQRLREENTKLAEEIGALLWDFTGSHEDAGLIAELRQEAQVNEACITAWLAIANVFEVAQ
ncbi:hypothetical protein [Deinococcus rubellus]|uniref:hypothetical protein n=1 Tax=Deinococcus rubellus TaxID=1889240 RepID=UPI0031EC6253